LEKVFKKPIPKCQNPQLPNDLRPISILLTLSKVIEKIANKQISNFLESTGQFDPNQSGFKSNHNTETALLKITEDIREGLDKNEISILTLLDFSKAFNTVNHNILLAKLSFL
jgi:hypothetical protein